MGGPPKVLGLGVWCTYRGEGWDTGRWTTLPWSCCALSSSTPRFTWQSSHCRRFWQRWPEVTSLTLAACLPHAGPPRRQVEPQGHLANSSRTAEATARERDLSCLHCASACMCTVRDIFAPEDASTFRFVRNALIFSTVGCLGSAWARGQESSAVAAVRPWPRTG